MERDSLGQPTDALAQHGIPSFSILDSSIDVNCFSEPLPLFFFLCYQRWGWQASLPPSSRPNTLGLSIWHNGQSLPGIPHSHLFCIQFKAFRHNSSSSVLGIFFPGSVCSSTSEFSWNVTSSEKASSLPICPFLAPIAPPPSFCGRSSVAHGFKLYLCTDGPCVLSTTVVPAAYHLVSQGHMDAFLESSESPTETRRSYFPETWIWDLVVVE